MFKKYIYFLFLIAKVHGTLVEAPMETINGGEYLYYNVTSFNHYVYLRLDTVDGDCDLYVSENDVSPTFDNYSLQSTTCGTDFVVVPKRFKRPVHVGVYGHPSYEKSDCILSVCLLEQPENVDVEYLDEWTEVSSLTDAYFQICDHDKRQGQQFFFHTFSIIVEVLAWIMSALVTFFSAWLSNDDWLFNIITALFI